MVHWYLVFILCKEKFEDTKRAIRSCNSKNGQYNGKTEKEQKTNRLLDKILNRKLKIEEHNPHLKSGMDSNALEG